MSLWFRPPDRQSAPPRPFAPPRHVPEATLHERLARAEAERDRASAALATAREEARAAGYAAGFTAAAASLDGRAAALVAELAPRVADALADFASFRAETAAAAAKLAVEAAAHIAGWRLPAVDTALVETVGAAVAAAGSRPELRVRAAPDLADGVRARWPGLAVDPDPTLARGAFTLAWDGGDLVSDPEARVHAVRAALDAAIL